MSAGSQVSYRAFLLRLRNLAKMALEKYRLERAELKFKNYSGNGLYQVIIPSTSRSEMAIPPGRYALRLHQPGYMRPQYIISELEWLSALCEADIDVPRPFKNLAGDWMTTVDGGYDVPRQRNCTLISWVEGRLLSKSIRAKHLRSLGRVIARMQEQSMLWKKPKKFKRPHWDWEGLYGDGFDYGFSAQDAREAIPKKHQKMFTDVLERVEEASQQLGKGKKAYGLIHADIGVDDNVAFHAGEARPFDFNDCGFSYWVFDLGVALAHYLADINCISSKNEDALIEGYKETSTLPESNLEYIDLFIGARYAQLMFFYQGCALQFPQHGGEARKEINHYAKHRKRILRRIR